MVRIINPNEPKKVRHVGGGTSEVTVEKTPKGWKQTIVTGEKVTVTEGTGTYGTSTSTPAATYTGSMQQVYTDPLGQPMSVNPAKAAQPGRQAEADAAAQYMTTRQGVVSTKEMHRQELISPPPRQEPTVMKPAGFFDYGMGGKLKQGVKTMGESVGYYSSFGGALDYKPSQESSFMPVVATGEEGTIVYRSSMMSELKPEQKAERRMITYPQMGLSTKDIQGRYETDVMMASIPGEFAKGAVIGGVSAILPPAGLAIGGVMGGGAIIRRGEIIAQFKAHPKETAILAGTGVAGGFAGGFGTSFAVPRVTGFVRTIGKTYIPEETIVEPRVLSGLKDFPEAPRSQHYDLFMKSKYKLPEEEAVGVWHAAPQPFKRTTKTTVGTSELPGLYTAPSVSAYFLKLKKTKYNIVGLNTESAIKTPTVIRIYPKGIRKGMPKELGFAYVPGMKSEIEAVIPPETPMIRTGARFYTKWGGIRVPIHQYNVGGMGTTGITAGKLVGSSSSYRGGRYSLITPQLMSYSFSNAGLRSVGLNYGRSYKKIGGVSRQNIFGLSSINLNYPFRSSYFKVSNVYKSYGKGYGRGRGYNYYGGGGYGLTGFPPYTPYYSPPSPPTKPWKPYFGDVFGGKKFKFSESFKRPFYYQPSMAAMGLGLKSPSIPKGYQTGLATRYNVPESVPLIGKRKRL